MIENGKNVVWRHAAPPGSVMIGAMTLTSCARDAERTRSACCSRVISRSPKTTASSTLYWSSSWRGATGQSSGRRCFACLLATSECRYQTFHSSNEIMMRLSLLRAAATWSAVATTCSMKRRHVDGRGQELLRIAVALLVVGVARDEVDVVERVLEHLRSHAPKVGIDRADDPHTTSSIDGIELAHALRGARRELAVVVGVAVAELPGPVHLVAEAPHLSRRTAPAPFAARSSVQRGRHRRVRVLEQVERLLRAARAEVDGEHEVAADLVEPRRELVQPDLVGLGRVPGEVEAPRTLARPGPTPSSHRYPETKLPPG